MKIRNGFVSNSSSSSFIIRGIRISRQEALDLLTDEQKEEYLNYDNEISECIESKNKELRCHPDKYYFEIHQSVAEHFIVGVDQGDLDDGIFYELSEPNDTLVGKLLIDLGLNLNNRRFKTYIQMISNDNF